MGNNNATTRTIPLSWMDWTLVEKRADLMRFVQHLLKFRANFERSRGSQSSSLGHLLDGRQIRWHGATPSMPDWGRDWHSLAFTRMGFQGNEQHLILLNAYWEPLEFALPPTLAQSAGWHRFIYTSMADPFDVNEPSCAPCIATGSYTVRPRSVVVLINKKAQKAALPEPVVE